MKVIVRGTPRADREYRLSCTDCGTVVTIAEREGKITSDQRDGSYITYPCPVCAKQMSATYGKYYNANVRPDNIDPY